MRSEWWRCTDARSGRAWMDAWPLPDPLPRAEITESAWAASTCRSEHSDRPLRRDQARSTFRHFCLTPCLAECGAQRTGRAARRGPDRPAQMRVIGEAEIPGEPGEV